MGAIIFGGHGEAEEEASFMEPDGSRGAQRTARPTTVGSSISAGDRRKKLHPFMLSLGVIRARDIDRLARFYAALGLQFTKHRHGQGPEHVSSTMGETVFEIYPETGANESTVSTRLGFLVPSLTNALRQLRGLDATVLAEPSNTPFGRCAVVKDFEGHKVELYEKAS